MLRVNKTDLKIDIIFYNPGFSMSESFDYPAGNTIVLYRISYYIISQKK